MPTISVVIPTFNRAHMVADAIRSAAGQEFPPLEIVVVDDGSTDNTQEIVCRIRTSVPIHYYPRTHGGQAAANNFGVSVSKGAWIAFLDSDDVWYRNKLATQAEFIAAQPQVPFVYSNLDYVVLDEAGCEHPTTRGWDSKLIPLLFQGNPNASVPTVMVRKDVLANEGGFNPTLTHGVDWELFARLASKYPIHCIPQCLGKQRLHAGQVTKNFRSKADSYYLFHARILELWREDPVRRRILIQDSARVYADLGKHFFQIGDYQYARRCFGRSLSIGPLSLKNWRRLGISFVPGLRSWYRLNTARRTTFGD